MECRPLSRLTSLNSSHYSGQLQAHFFFTMILGESYPKDNKLKVEWNETMCKKKKKKNQIWSNSSANSFRIGKNYSMDEENF